ncbi:MAG TPA: hypothetical protein ENJ79_00395 [Gammaproteobacteria bacterium]|nr:hypothetical protein [Gammaproteobacteria bacterium]
MFSDSKRSGQPPPPDEAETVTNQAMILATLHQIKALHELLSVRVHGLEREASTAIIGIREDENCFFLDELNLAAAHQAFVRTGRARINARLNGMEIRLPCRLEGVGKADGIAFYRVQIPSRMVRNQRRQHFRLRLGPGQTVTITVPRLEGRRARGQALDLSTGGLGALLNTEQAPVRGQVLGDVHITLPGAADFRTSLEVRFARLDPHTNQLRVGCRFLRLDMKQERLVSQFLAEQQRKRRRHGPV